MRALGARIYARRAEVVIPHAISMDPTPVPAAGEDVLAVGRLEHRKGSDVLICAWRQVHARRPTARLHLVGSDSAGFGAAAIARWGGSGIVRHGSLTDAALARVAAGCGIQVVPSRYESFGITVLEGWRAGLAVVASDAGALPEVVGDAGIVVPAGQPEPLAAALIGLLDAPHRRHELAARGARRLGSCFNPGAMAEASISAYRAAIQRRSIDGWTCARRG
jgi:glycosyltransferase involved in cell wall biosynthesis